MSNALAAPSPSSRHDRERHQVARVDAAEVAVDRIGGQALAGNRGQAAVAGVILARVKPTGPTLDGENTGAARSVATTPLVIVQHRLADLDLHDGRRT